MTPRIHLPSLLSQEHPLPQTLADLPLQPLDEPAAHHLLRVLRRTVGDELEVFDGQSGRCWRARLASTKPARVELLVELPPEPLPRVQLGLAQCLSTAEKMDWTIEKAVELGVSHIVPLLSARSVVKLDGARAEKRREHWQRLVVAAAMQCGRSRLPTLAPIQPLERWLAALPAPAATERRWVLDPTAQASLAMQAMQMAQASPGQALPAQADTVFSVAHPASGLTASVASTPAPAGTGLPGGSPSSADDTLPSVGCASSSGTAFPAGEALPPSFSGSGSGSYHAAWLLCGPESGLSEEEMARAKTHGWQGALLGPRVLRTETAGLVGLAVLQATLGDLA